MLDPSLVSERVREIVQGVMHEYGLPSPREDDDSLSAAGLTSMAMVRLMLVVELTFDLSIPDSQLRPENFRSIRTIERLLERLQCGDRQAVA